MSARRLSVGNEKAVSFVEENFATAAAISRFPDEMDGVRTARTDDLTPAEEARSAVHVGLWISATRCLVTYVVAPALGALGVLLGPIGLLLQILGAITASAGARRLWILRHRIRLPYLAVAIAIDLTTVMAVLHLLGVLR